MGSRGHGRRREILEVYRAVGDGMELTMCVAIHDSQRVNALRVGITYLLEVERRWSDVLGQLLCTHPDL